MNKYIFLETPRGILTFPLIELVVSEDPLKMIFMIYRLYLLVLAFIYFFYLLVRNYLTDFKVRNIWLFSEYRVVESLECTIFVSKITIF